MGGGGCLPGGGRSTPSLRSEERPGGGPLYFRGILVLWKQTLGETGIDEREVLLPSSLLVAKKVKLPPGASVGTGSLRASTDLAVNLMQIRPADKEKRSELWPWPDLRPACSRPACP